MPEVVAALCVALAGFREWMLMLTSFERSHLSAQISELGKSFFAVPEADAKTRSGEGKPMGSILKSCVRR